MNVCNRCLGSGTQEFNRRSLVAIQTFFGKISISNDDVIYLRHLDGNIDITYVDRADLEGRKPKNASNYGYITNEHKTYKVLTWTDKEMATVNKCLEWLATCLELDEAFNFKKKILTAVGRFLIAATKCEVQSRKFNQERLRK